MQFDFTKPKLIRKTIKMAKFPHHGIPEIAIIGKSNCGKSSFINNFLKKPGLALTSSTPGRTREFFFFNLHDQTVIVDLPGYGYASVSKTTKKEWSETIGDYLRGREELQMVLFLLDLRRTPDENDLRTFDLIIERGLPTIFVLTKLDKLKKNEIQKRVADIKETLDLRDGYFVLYSSLKNQGRSELVKLLQDAFSD